MGCGECHGRLIGRLGVQCISRQVGSTMHSLVVFSAAKYTCRLTVVFAPSRRGTNQNHYIIINPLLPNSL